MVDQINGIASGLVATRWFDDAGTEGDVIQNVNWFPNDLKPSQEARKRFALDDAFTVVKHTLQIVVPNAVQVAVLLKLVSQNVIPILEIKTFLLNGGTDLVVNAGFQFDLILVAGSSYNIQHTTTQDFNPAVFITESFNVDI